MPTVAEILAAEIAAYGQAIANFNAQIAQAEIAIRLATTLRDTAQRKREFLIADQESLQPKAESK